MPAVPARRAQALPQGRALLYGQVRDRTGQLSTRRAWPGAYALFRICDSPAREAESQANLWSNGDAVQTLLRDGRADARGYRREPASAARAPARQHGLSAGLRQFARAGTSDRA